MVLEETLEGMRKQWKDVTISHVRDPVTVKNCFLLLHFKVP